MSRTCYSDDFGEDFPGQIDLFRANVRRSIQSRDGQARLRELRDALQSLSVKELAASIFAEEASNAPRVCALGAWALAKCGGNVHAARAMVPADADDHETYDALKSHGWPRLVVLDAIYMNDDGGVWKPETPAQRYERVLAWVESNIAHQ